MYLNTTTQSSGTLRQRSPDVSSKPVINRVTACIHAVELEQIKLGSHEHAHDLVPGAPGWSTGRYVTAHSAVMRVERVNQSASAPVFLTSLAQRFGPNNVMIRNIEFEVRFSIADESAAAATWLAKVLASKLPDFRHASTDDALRSLNFDGRRLRRVKNVIGGRACGAGVFEGLLILNGSSWHLTSTTAGCALKVRSCIDETIGSPVDFKRLLPLFVEQGRGDGVAAPTAASLNRRTGEALDRVSDGYKRLFQI
jgi:hypothetical protein